MEIKLINHASVIIRCGQTRILTDPWFQGTAFNNSWALLSENEPSLKDLKLLDYIWISHEHPDHFHLPTLKTIVSSVNESCTVILQKKNSEKMLRVLKSFGYKNFLQLRHDSICAIAEDLDIYSYQIGLMDSVMGIRFNGQVVLNINDCSLEDHEIRRIKKRLGARKPILLNQFSLAGNNGSEKNMGQLEEKANSILRDMIRIHNSFGALTTIPFASLMFFASPSNSYMNSYRNSMNKVRRVFDENLCDLTVLYYNETYFDGAKDMNEAAADRWDEIYDKAISNCNFDPYRSIELEELLAAVKAKRKELLKRYPRFLVRKCGSIIIYVGDHGKKYNLNLIDSIFEEIETDSYDVKIDSQPLHHALSTPWGIQTIGVAAQYFIESNWKTWSWYRLVFNLNNMEIYLRMRYLIKPDLARYLMERIRLTSIIIAVTKVRATFISPITEE